uniref:Uncharacterized protein MANES_01G056600 n=1 Tax=Rhizophora mucronata TaxID=61149 RepID=A0A2P2QL67_RHIMU
MICWRHLSASARSRHSEARYGRRSLGFFFSSAFSAMYRFSIDCAFSSFLAMPSLPDLQAKRRVTDRVQVYVMTKKKEEDSMAAGRRLQTPEDNDVVNMSGPD